MKLIIVLALWALFCVAAYAAPTLTSSPYSTATTQPTSATLSIDGAQTVVCTVPKDAAGTVTAVCDLATVPAGTHTLILNVANTYGCTQSADGLTASCVGGGTASSVPFTYTWNPVSASKPSLLFKP